MCNEGCHGSHRDVSIPSFCVDSTLVFCNVVKREAKGKELFSSTDIDESYVVTPTVPMSRWDTL